MSGNLECRTLFAGTSETVPVMLVSSGRTTCRVRLLKDARLPGGLHLAGEIVRVPPSVLSTEDV